MQEERGEQGLGRDGGENLEHAITGRKKWQCITFTFLNLLYDNVTMLGSVLWKHNFLLKRNLRLISAKWLPADHAHHKCQAHTLTADTWTKVHGWHSMTPPILYHHWFFTSHFFHTLIFPPVFQEPSLSSVRESTPIRLSGISCSLCIVNAV